MVKQLKINWQMGFPPLKAERWQDLSEVNLAVLPAHQLICQELGWPGASLAVLDFAFSKKLDRQTGWQADDCDQSLAIEQASRVFKRGVAFRKGKSEGVLYVPLSGEYQIEFLDEPTPQIEKSSDDFVIIDGNVAEAWPHLASLSDLTLTLTEQQKELSSVAKIISYWKEKGAPKHWLIVGGGVLSDVAAFAAHLVGCSFEFVPTTLLSMVDACVGGKTGVNYAPYGKNQVGAFAFPSRVRIYASWLKTLSDREIVSGGAECLKHAILAGEEVLLRDISSALDKRSIEQIAQLLPPLVRLKAEVVKEDANESGRRATLNLGHTLAHAIEAVSHRYDLPPEKTIQHGEAVALGLAYAIILSEQCGHLDKKGSDLLKKAIVSSRCLIDRKSFESYTGDRKLEDETLWRDISSKFQHDKKFIHTSDEKSSQWILLKSLGEVQKNPEGRYVVDVSLPTLEKAWQAFTAFLPSY